MMIYLLADGDIMMILATTIHDAWMVIGMMIMMTVLMQTLPIKPLSSVMAQLQTRPDEWSDREMAAGSKLTGISIKKDSIWDNIAQIRAR